MAISDNNSTSLQRRITHIGDFSYWRNPHHFWPCPAPYPVAPPATTNCTVTFSPPQPVTVTTVIQTLAGLVDAGKISEETFAKCVEALKK